MAAGAGLIAAVVIIAVLRPDSEGTADVPPVASSSGRESAEPGGTEVGDPVAGVAPSPATNPATRGEASATWELEESTPVDVTEAEVDMCGDPVATARLPFRPLEEPTGVRLLIGAGTELEIDTGLVTEPMVHLDDDEFVSQIVRHNDVTYLGINGCDRQSIRVVAIAGDGAVTPVQVPIADGETAGGLVATGQGPMVQVSDEERRSVGLQPLTGGPLIPLTGGFSSVGSWGDTLVGITVDETTSTSDVVSIDPATGEVEVLVDFQDQVRMVLAGAGRVFWAVGEGAVPLSVLDLSTGETTTTAWDLPAGFAPIQVSPDGRHLLGSVVPGGGEVVALGPDEILRSARVLLDVRTGEVLPIPSLQRVQDHPTAVRVVFAGDGSRVLIFLRTQDGVQILTWAPGEEMLYGTPRLLPSGTAPWLALLPITPGAQTEGAGGR